MLIGRPLRVAQRVPRRPQVPREHRAFVCPLCDRILADGVAYEYCPACDARVDWVDLRRPVFTCPGCEGLVNAECPEPPYCEVCERKLVPTHVPGTAASPSARGMSFFRSSPVLVAVYLVALVPSLSLALDAQVKWLFIAVAAPVVFLPALLALTWLGLFAASLRELRGLIADRGTRVVHGLEHATVKVLERAGLPVAGGRTWKRSFDVYFDGDVDGSRRRRAIRNAFREAVRRILEGERRLAYDPRCGTSLLVATTLMAMLGVAGALVGLLVELTPHQLLFGFGAATLTLVVGSRFLGLAAQRFLTVSTVFRSARLVRVVRRPPRGSLLRYEVVVDLNHADARDGAKGGVDRGSSFKKSAYASTTTGS